MDVYGTVMDTRDVSVYHGSREGEKERERESLRQSHSTCSRNDVSGGCLLPTRRFQLSVARQSYPHTHTHDIQAPIWITIGFPPEYSVLQNRSSKPWAWLRLGIEICARVSRKRKTRKSIVLSEFSDDKFSLKDVCTIDAFEGDSLQRCSVWTNRRSYAFVTFRTSITGAFWIIDIL